MTAGRPPAANVGEWRTAMRAALTAAENAAGRLPHRLGRHIRHDLAAIARASATGTSVAAAADAADRLAGLLDDLATIDVNGRGVLPADVPTVPAPPGGSRS